MLHFAQITLDVIKHKNFPKMDRNTDLKLFMTVKHGGKFCTSQNNMYENIKLVEEYNKIGDWKLC